VGQRSAEVLRIIAEVYCTDRPPDMCPRSATATSTLPWLSCPPAWRARRRWKPPRDRASCAASRTSWSTAPRLNADYQIHAVEIGDPFVHHDQFTVRFAFDQSHMPSGTRETAVKISLYTVAEGAIVREEVYYHTPPHPPGH
jgi:hypothetical protein